MSGIFTGRVGPEGTQQLADRVGSGQGVIEMAWVSSDRTRRFASLTGRVRREVIRPGKKPWKIWLVFP